MAAIQNHISFLYTPLRATHVKIHTFTRYAPKINTFSINRKTDFIQKKHCRLIK